MMTGENSLDGAPLCVRRGGSRGRSSRNHDVTCEEKSASGVSTAGKISPAFSAHADGFRPLVPDHENGLVLTALWVPSHRRSRDAERLHQPLGQGLLQFLLFFDAISAEWPYGPALAGKNL